ncbi:MAG: hypothetical protein MJ151_02100, partial [Lachnospiraceae bacterium]|nr:hypothetical protein [Lachnospiraceae bacterium]
MKKMMICKKIISSLLMMCSILLLVGCSGRMGLYDIALITDIGQLMDAGFNQGTWEGMREFAVNKDKKYNYYQPVGDGDIGDEERIKAMRQAINDGAKIIIVPGYSQADALAT